MTGTDTAHRHNKILFYILLAILIVGAMGIFYSIRHRPAAVNNTNPSNRVEIDGIYLPQAKAIASFSLTDDNGQVFTQENLKGHWTMLFFGFTNCASVCPASMAELNKMYQQLQAELNTDQLPQVVMVSVDPKRDSVERMHEYVKTFNPNFIGARAEQAATTALEKQLHIVAALIPSTDKKHSQDYSINHSAEVIVIDPNGQLRAYLSYPHVADRMAQDYKKILSAQS